MTQFFGTDIPCSQYRSEQGRFGASTRRGDGKLDGDALELLAIPCLRLQHGFRNCAARSTSPRRSPPTRPQYHTRGNVLSIRCQAFALNFLKSWSSGGCLPANPVRNADVPSPVPWVTIRSVCAAIPRAAIIPLAGRYMEKILSRVKRDNRKNSPYLPHCAVAAVRIRDVSLVREPKDAQRIRIVPVSLKTGVRHFFAHRPSSLRVPQTHQRLPKNDAHACRYIPLTCQKRLAEQIYHLIDLLFQPGVRDCQCALALLPIAHTP